MPRQHVNNYVRDTCAFPNDFPQRLVRFKEAADLSWAELCRRLGVDRETLRRWRDKGVRPNAEHLVALLALADSFGLGYIFRD